MLMFFMPLDRDEFKENLNQDFPILFEWVYQNVTIIKPEKCHYLCLIKHIVSDLLWFCREVIKASEIETVLEIELDNKLKFD